MSSSSSPASADTRSTPEQISELREQLVAWVERVSADAGEPEEDMIEAGCLIAFYRKGSLGSE